jgi:hypothetical protein
MEQSSKFWQLWVKNKPKKKGMVSKREFLIQSWACKLLIYIVLNQKSGEDKSSEEKSRDIFKSFLTRLEIFDIIIRKE